MEGFSKLLSKLSGFLSNRKGFLLLIAVILVFMNFFLGLLFNNWLTQSALFLHVGIIIGLIGVMIAWAL